MDAVFYAWALRSYTRTNRYTGIILAYVFGAGAMTVAVSPNFGRLFKRQAANEGARRALAALFPVVELLWCLHRLLQCCKAQFDTDLAPSCKVSRGVSRAPASRSSCLDMWKYHVLVHVCSLPALRSSKQASMSCTSRQVVFPAQVHGSLHAC